jgi:hypothetical protein
MHQDDLFAAGIKTPYLSESSSHSHSTTESSSVDAIGRRIARGQLY